MVAATSVRGTTSMSRGGGAAVSRAGGRGLFLRRGGSGGDGGGSTTCGAIGGHENEQDQCVEGNDEGDPGQRAPRAIEYGVSWHDNPLNLFTG